MAYLTKSLFRNSFENRGKETEKILLVAERLQSMKKHQGSVQRQLQEYLNSRIDTAARDLSCYLKSPEVQEEFTTWTSDNVPVHEDSWAVTDNTIKKTPKAAQLRDTNLLSDSYIQVKKRIMFLPTIVLL